MYDPCGLWEPLKLQMKLAMIPLNGLGWTDPVPKELHDEWITLFQTLADCRAVRLKRSIIPEDHVTPIEFRTIVMADAATDACGAAVYCGVRRKDGTFSSNLIVAKSKLVKGSIPRNELEGVVLAAETSLQVARVVRPQPEPARFYTDSRVVLCWVLNKSKRLRMWVFNRVQAVYNMIKHSACSQTHIPLYHIEGSENVADLLTKPAQVKVSQLENGSWWQVGPDWMSLPTADLPGNQDSTLTKDVEDVYNQETFQEIVIHQMQEEAEKRAILDTNLDVFLPGTQCYSGEIPQDSRPQVPHPQGKKGTKKSAWLTWFQEWAQFGQLGWIRTRARVRAVLTAGQKFKHRLHQVPDQSQCPDCNHPPETPDIKLDYIIAKAASEELNGVLPSKKLQERLHLKDDVWYARSRLSKEGPVDIQDLDCSPFFDQIYLQEFTPAVWIGSDIFHALLAHIHFKEHPHRGVETTLKRIRERFFVVGNVRAAIFKFKAACSKCRLMARQTVDLELGDFPLARTTVAPPFWAVQLDIAMSFRGRANLSSKKSFPCNALIIVCLLTSATNILAMDGLTTQAVVMALERHAARYGMPKHLYVDSGTQLAKLEDARFKLRDVALRTAGDKFQVTVATPRAHHQQGRVEAKIKVMRRMLNSWGTNCPESNTLLGWETVFARLASAINDVPIARGSASAATDFGWDVITPNRLLLGRNNFRQLAGPVVVDNCPKSQLERNRRVSKRWYEIFIDKIHHLVPQPLRKNQVPPKVGDVVLFVHTDPNLVRLWVWKLGIIIEQKSRSTFEIRYVAPDGKSRTLIRSAAQVSIIVPAGELGPASPGFLNLRR